MEDNSVINMESRNRNKLTNSTEVFVNKTKTINGLIYIEDMFMLVLSND